MLQKSIRFMTRLIMIGILIAIEIILAPLLFLIAALARFAPKSKDIGLGPEPLINNIYHARALHQYGWSAETFVDSVYYITSDFDIMFIWKNKLLTLLSRILCVPFVFSIYRYRILYIYFSGGGLRNSRMLWVIEPLLYRLAGVKVLVMPYGGDVQDMQKCPNLAFKHAVDKDYPRHFRLRHIISAKVWLWSRYADHVISGCDWVDYMQHWDTLCISHIAIELDDHVTFTQAKSRESKTLKILHAPNHREIKGTKFFEYAVKKLRDEGLDIELVTVQGESNKRIKELIVECDIVADQLIIGWYAMFAIEAMAMSKPVLCYLRDDLQDLYYQAGLLNLGEIPLINCNPQTVTDVIRDLASWPDMKLTEYGLRGRKYVERHHSLFSIGSMFDSINIKLGANRV